MEFVIPFICAMTGAVMFTETAPMADAITADSAAKWASVRAEEINAAAVASGVAIPYHRNDRHASKLVIPGEVETVMVA